MSSVCTKRCIDDAYVPIRRTTYISLYRRPESNAAFVRSFSSNGRIEGGTDKHHRRMCEYPTVVDSVSCRQMYLRSYTFTRKESVHERTKKCFGRVREKVAKNPSCRGIFSCAVVFRAFHKLISCTGTKVDVVD